MAQPAPKPPLPPPPQQQQQQPPETPCSDRPPPSYAQSVAASMASVPSVIRHARTNAAIAQVHHLDGAIDSITDPIDLFASDYDKVNGRVLNIVPSPRKAAAKRNVPLLKPSPASAGASSKKVAPSSPHCPAGSSTYGARPSSHSPRRGGGLLVTAAMIATATQQNNLVGPPSINRDGPSPASALANLFQEPAPPKRSTADKKGGKGMAMRGLVPYSGFLGFMRPHLFQQEGQPPPTVPIYSEAQVQKDLGERTKWTRLAAP